MSYSGEESIVEDSELGLTLEKWVVLGREEKDGTPPAGRSHL